MNLEIHLENNQLDFVPSQTIRGTIYWDLNKVAKVLELDLYWETYGDGDIDSYVDQRLTFDCRSKRGQEDFEIDLPHAPYSFSGKRVSLGWSLILAALPSKEETLVDITFGPNGCEVVL